MTWVRLNMVVEGQTEEAFANEVLNPHLSNFSIAVSARMLSHTGGRSRNHKGGIRRIGQLTDDLKRWAREDTSKDVRFTTMVDLYAYPSDAPRYGEAKRLCPYERVELLEKGLKDVIDDRRFIPYIQLHEFETMLFSDFESWHPQFPDRTPAIEALAASVASFENVEFVNDTPESAPSKRVLKYLPEYQKVIAGSVLALEIGLPRIRERCRHFDTWLSALESRHEM